MARTETRQESPAPFRRLLVNSRAGYKAKKLSTSAIWLLLPFLPRYEVKAPSHRKPGAHRHQSDSVYSPHLRLSSPCVDSLPVEIRPTSGQRFVCPVRDCKQGAFGRAADLDRHHKMVHLPDEEKKKFFCDYKKCPRHDSPFYRQDHFRDHLRDFHKEDLLRRGTKADGKWWDSRSKHAIFTGWWRCNKCLVTRVDIETNGWVCPKCSTHCETERKRFRSSGQR